MTRARRKTKPALRLRVIAEAGEARAEALALAQRLDETARLERARGGEVVREEGRMRIPSRDGLQTLRERGGLEGPEYEAGLMYRRCSNCGICARPIVCAEVCGTGCADVAETSMPSTALRCPYSKAPSSDWSARVAAANRRWRK